MPNTCFVSGCKSGHQSQHKAYKLNGLKIPTIHRVPKNPVVFQQWQKAIHPTGRLLKPCHYVCSRHFKKEDFIYCNDPVKLRDGNVYLHMLEIPRLKKDAVPSIFIDTPDHSSHVLDIKSSKKRKYRKQKDQSVAKQLKIQFGGAEIAENEKSCFTSKEKENVLKTDFSLLPSIILNCLTSEPHSVLSSLNKINTNECKSPHSQSTPQNDCSSESPTSSSQLHSENTAAKENTSIMHSKLNSDIVSKVPDKVLSFLELLSSNIEIISFQPNKACDVPVKPQFIYKSPDVTKDISISSQDIVELSDSQSNMTNSEVAHNYSDASNSHLDFRENAAPINHLNKSTTKSYADLQPLEPVNIVSTEPDVILKPPSNNLIRVTVESKTFRQPTIYPKESERDVDVILSGAKNQFCFDFLKTNAHKINPINSRWTVNTFDDFVAYARWSSDYLVDRKIIIYKDLKIKVFLKDEEVILENSLKAMSFKNLSKLILRVESL